MNNEQILIIWIIVFSSIGFTQFFWAMYELFKVTHFDSYKKDDDDKGHSLSLSSQFKGKEQDDKI